MNSWVSNYRINSSSQKLQIPYFINSFEIDHSRSAGHGRLLAVHPDGISHIPGHREPHPLHRHHECLHGYGVSSNPAASCTLQRGHLPTTTACGWRTRWQRGNSTTRFSARSLACMCHQCCHIPGSFIDDNLVFFHPGCFPLPHSQNLSQLTVIWIAISVKKIQYYITSCNTCFRGLSLRICVRVV